MTRFRLDAIERVLWTFLEAGLATVSVEAFDLPRAWAIPIAAAIAGLKAVLARKVGDPESASTFPQV